MKKKETILKGIPLLTKTLTVCLLIIGVLTGLLFGMDWLWKYNRVLGILAMVTCVVVTFLIVSYLIGLDIGEKK